MMGGCCRGCNWARRATGAGFGAIHGLSGGVVNILLVYIYTHIYTDVLSLAMCYSRSYCSIVVSEDAAHTCMSSLGRLGVVQFADLNSTLTPFQRRYVAFIKRIDELDRKIK